MQVDFEQILTDFDRLLPLYEFVEGTDAFPAITPVNRFNFRPGHTRRSTRTVANVVGGQSEVYLRHNEIQDTLHGILSSYFGQDMVGTEHPNGIGGCLDLVVQQNSEYWFYEIKTGGSARACIRQALAQILEYAYWPGATEAKRLIIVGEPGLDREAENYLRLLRERFSLPIYYQQINIEQASLTPHHLEP